MASSPDSGSVIPRVDPRPIGLVVIRVLTLLALAVSGYLLVISVGQRQLPVGCGTGSGCASVLSSRWSAVLGVPVGAAAVGIYVIVLAASFFIGARKCSRQQQLGWLLLIGCAAAITAAAGWFIYLQVVVLQAFCPWCMADHGLGLLISIGIALHVAKHYGSPSYVTDCNSEAGTLPILEVSKPPLGRMAVAPVIAGIASVIALAVVQLTFEGSVGRTIRLPPGKNADTGPGVHRQVAVIDGKFQLAPHEQPILGNPDSPKLLIVLFDYCCPHCRAAHGYLINSLPAFQGQLSVLLMPMPMDGKCNKTVEHTERRFEHACVLARLALAVWRAKPSAFADYDKWLFETEQPRDPVSAQKRAEELVGAAVLKSTLADRWIDQQIAANIQAYVDSGADRIPIIMSPGFSSIVGRPESEEELLRTLQTELHP